jgi:PTH1 family peptidyl-tRNA hydrolase
LIAGLGNPGREYSDTRHNIGFVVVDAFAATHGAAWARRRDFNAEVAKISRPGSPDLHLLKPLTFMNESGVALGPFCRFHRIPSNEVVVVFDELNLPIGQAKLSVTGSAGGHNGLASVLEHVGPEVRRFRIGIGPRHPPQIELKDYVLGKLTPEQQSIVEKKTPEFLESLDLLLSRGVTIAMNRINRRTKPDDSSSNQEI